MLAPWKKSYDKPIQHIQKQRHYFVYKCQNSQSCSFPSSHVWMWELDNKKDWALKNWCLQTVILEKTPESLLDSKDIKSINTKGNQPWIFIRRTDAEAEAPTFWPRDVKSWLILKDPNAGKDWRQEEKRITEDEIVGWHWENSRRFWRTGKPGILQSMSCKELDKTEQLNNNKQVYSSILCDSN